MVNHCKNKPMKKPESQNQSGTIDKVGTGKKTTFTGVKIPSPGKKVSFTNGIEKTVTDTTFGEKGKTREEGIPPSDAGRGKNGKLADPSQGGSSVCKVKEQTHEYTNIPQHMSLGLKQLKKTGKDT